MNKTSALKSRVTKKLEITRLREQIDIFNQQVKFLAETLTNELSDNSKEVIQNDNDIIAVGKGKCKGKSGSTSENKFTDFITKFLTINK